MTTASAEIDFSTFQPDTRASGGHEIDYAMPYVQHVVLDRAEGPTRPDGSMPIAVVRSMAAASALLRDWSTTAPKGGAYDKVDFWVTWTDGEVYRGRYDLQHWSVPGERCDLAAHVVDYLRWVATVRQRDEDRARLGPALVSEEDEASARAWLVGRRFN